MCNIVKVKILKTKTTTYIVAFSQNNLPSLIFGLSKLILVFTKGKAITIEF